MSESKTCGACGAKYFGEPCPLCNAKVRSHAGDPGISRAQILEKLDSLERRHEQSLKMCAASDHWVTEKIRALEIRIAELESQQERWRGTQRYVAPIDVEDV